MDVVTEYRTSDGPPKKAFVGSYSKLKNYETCPRRHHEVDVLKNFKEEDSEQLLWGNEVHKHAAARIRDKTPLPHTMEELIEPWVQRILANSENSIILVEQKLALTRKFGPCGYFDKDVWWRSVGDVVKITGDLGLTADWKSGKILEDGSQLAINAACIFAHYPQVNIVRSEFIWLKFDASSRLDFHRNKMADVWRTIIPRIETLEHAYEIGSFPPKKGYLCKSYCPVRSCEFYGDNN